MSIFVGPEEMNIQTTVVYLRALHAAGLVPLPLAVELCLPGQEHSGWRQAAIEHLDGVRKDKRPRKFSESKWAEINEELDFYDKRANS